MLSRIFFSPSSLFTFSSLSTLLFSLSASAAPDELSSVLVEASELSTSTPGEQDSLEAALERIAQLPGAGSMITPDDWIGRALTPQDIFAFDPGVYVRSRSLGNDARLSIRGSGIQRQFGDRGISLLLDGIRANDLDGSFFFRTIDPLTIDHVEVYRGANGLLHGGSQLGGAVNIIQKNGLNAPGTTVQIEAGSFDTYRAAFQHGGSNELWDWFIGYTYSESDGYRQQTQTNTHQVTANLGYNWSDAATTRFFFLYSDSDADLTGSLTPDQFRANPRQRSSRRAPDADRDLSTMRLGQRTEWETANGKWSFFTNYQYLDFDHLINRGGPFLFNRLIDYDTDDFQIGLHGEESGTLFGLENTLRFDTQANHGRQKEDGFGEFIGFVPPGQPIPEANALDRENIATNFQIYVENDLNLTDKHHLILGAGWVHSTRQVKLGRGDEQGDSEIDISENGAVYRAGYLYEFSEQTQLFANYSQSFEASPFAEATGNDEPLDPQFARTFEIGGRFGNDVLSGELAYYRSEVKDEFIFEEIAPGLSETSNLDSIHQGVEAALSLNITSLLGGSQGAQLHFDQSYQWNDFTIDEGANDGNRLPGVSEHVYTGRLRLEGQDRKWSVSVAADWLPEGFIVDNANTIDTAGFVVWKLAADFVVNDQLSFFGGVDNLFDKDFVNTATVNPSSDAFINPGDGRAFYVGAKVRW